jgi:hypothetical protein
MGHYFSVNCSSADFGVLGNFVTNEFIIRAVTTYHQTLDDYLSAFRKYSWPCEMKSLAGV